MFDAASEEKESSSQSLIFRSLKGCSSGCALERITIYHVSSLFGHYYSLAVWVSFLTLVLVLATCALRQGHATLLKPSSQKLLLHAVYTTNSTSCVLVLVFSRRNPINQINNLDSRIKDEIITHVVLSTFNFLI